MPRLTVANAIPAMASSGNKTVAVVTTPDGNLQWTTWTLGGAGAPWKTAVIKGVARFTDVAPAVSFRTTVGGVTTWLGIRDELDGQIYETLQSSDGSFLSWVRIPGITTNGAPAVNDGNLAIGVPIMAAIAAPPDEVTYINTYLNDQPPANPPADYWKPLQPSPITTLAPAISIVDGGNYMFLVAPVINFSGPNLRLVLYQGSPYNPDELSIGYMNFDSNISPAMGASHNRTVIVAADPNGALFYNWWDFGGGDHGWLPFGTDVKTKIRPAVSVVDSGNYMFILATGLDGNLYLNQGIVGGAIVGWQRA